MYAFNYHRATSLKDAEGALAAGGKLLAGGQTLIPTLKQRLDQVEALVDVGHLSELSGISLSGNTLVIGAATPHAQVAANAEIQSQLSALAALAGTIGDAQVRNVGTIGGSVANNDPAADYPAAVLGLGARIETNQRTIQADDFFKGLFETALEDNEIIVKFHFDLPKRAGYVKFDQPASRYALVSVFVAETQSGTRVAVSGASENGVFRVSDFERRLNDNFSPQALDGASVQAAGMMSDIFGTAEYRAHLVRVLAQRAVTAATS